MSGSLDRPELHGFFAPGDEASQSPATEHPARAAKPAREIGGREGPDLVRYGDWDKAGRSVDF